MAKSGGRAFPVLTDQYGRRYEGMTMRQYYKAVALQGILARDDISAKSAIEGAAIYADAMLAEDDAHDKAVA